MNDKNQDWVTTIASIAGIALIVIFLANYPEEGTAVINAIFDWMIANIGSLLLWSGILAIVYSLCFACSKYGNIRLGSGKPKYSTFSYLSMMFCAGLGSSSIYWSFTEWTYYYTGPPFGIEPMSHTAAEWATAYNIYHWGIIAWGIFAILSIPVAYAYHIRKVNALRLGTVIVEMLPEKMNAGAKGLIRTLVDIAVIFGVASCCGVMLGLGAPMISNGFAKITGLELSFGLNICVILGIAVVYTISSYVGTEKGMQTLSNVSVYGILAFVAFILIVGPTDFILRQTTNGIGLMIQNFVVMSTYTDPVLKGGFPDSWTIFFWVYGYACAMFMILFITKISEGRTLRQMSLGVAFGGSTGCLVFMGINGSYSMSQQLQGKIDLVRLMAEKGGDEAIMQLIGALPGGNFAILYFIFIAAIFMATTLDSAAFSLAASTTKNLKSEDNTSPILRLFWCVVLAAIPLCMIFINAPLSSLKTIVIIAGSPIIVISVFMVIRLRAWLKEDYDKLPELHGK